MVNFVGLEKTVTLSKNKSHPLPLFTANYSNRLFHSQQLFPVNLYKPFFWVDVTIKFCISMMFNFLNNVLNISKNFIKVLFDVTHSMLLSSINSGDTRKIYINFPIFKCCNRVSYDFKDCRDLKFQLTHVFPFFDHIGKNYCKICLGQIPKFL